MEQHASLFHALGEYQYLGAASASAALLMVGGAIVRSQAKSRLKKDDVLPDAGLSFWNLAVWLVNGFRNLLSGMVGHGSDRYVPLVGGTFMLILFNNLLGMVPGLLSASSNLINNLSMALVIFFVYQYYGLREHGLGYIKQFTGGLPGHGQPLVMTIFLSLIAILIFFIELIGHVVRPFSLTLRLWGTITGDHALYAVTNGMLPIFLPMLALAMGLLVSVVQAFVFSLLSTVYIKLAVSHDH